MDILANFKAAEIGTPAADEREQPRRNRPQVEIRKHIPQRKRLHLPKTFEERAELGVRELRVPATWEEYLELADTCDYRVHYREGHIISFIEIEEKTGIIMGEASIPHETLVMRFGTQLSILLDDLNSDFRVLGSNTKIFIAENRKGFNADVTVVKGTPEVKKYTFNNRKTKGLVNPWLIVEVLSDSTRNFDLSEKLNDYKQIRSLEQVIFAEQGKVWASTFIRTGEREWENLDFDQISDSIPIAGGLGQIRLDRVFKNVFSTEISTEI